MVAAFVRTTMSAAAFLLRPLFNLRMLSFRILLCTIIVVCAGEVRAASEQADHSSELTTADVRNAAVQAQAVPVDRLLTDDELVDLLDAEDNAALASIKALYGRDNRKGLFALSRYFKEAFSNRYFFDWQNTDERFQFYAKNFPSKRTDHALNKDIHTSLYPAAAQWQLPYKNLKGEDVTAYELRHLARQHKALDMAYMHHYENGNPLYVDYFTAQLRSLNAAFANKRYEDDSGGNGVYESYRAGTRVINWLQIHAFYLGDQSYGWQDQLETIKTLLHEGASLQEKNQQFVAGNHQTRGVSALAVIAILFNEYPGAEAWYENAMDLLEQHLIKEVNQDGFQFERSVHYHIDDIFNYFYAFQLATLNNFAVSELWSQKLRAMFDALVVLARPDKNLPVLQDDTDSPGAEFNDISTIAQLGGILFNEPAINYFASKSVSAGYYWYLRAEQLNAIDKLSGSKPALRSAALPQTGYYVMRDGWAKDDLHMTVSAGLSAEKPDHQHGDSLGIVAFANQQDILPNYQVRYFLEDYEFFKNSYAKNVAIVDSIPQGVGWQSNQGGSGFGKWRKLPKPRVISWANGKSWDYFAGSHNGYNDIGVEYYRKVFFLKGLGWIVRDIFSSASGKHDYQQIWQGHYSESSSTNHHQSVFADGSGLEIVQLGDQAEAASTQIVRGKGHLIYSMNKAVGEYTTLLYPSKSFMQRLPEQFLESSEYSLKGWEFQRRTSKDLMVGKYSTNAALVLVNSQQAMLLGASYLKTATGELKFSEPTDLLIDISAGKQSAVRLWNHKPVDVQATGVKLADAGAINRLQGAQRYQPNSELIIHW